MIATQHFARTANTGLHLIRNKQHIMLTAQMTASLQITIIGHKNPRFALNWLNQKTGNLVALLFKQPLQRINIIIRNNLYTRGVRTIIGTCIRIGRKRNNSNGSSMEITFTGNNNRLIFRYAFFLIPPFASQLKCSFNCLGT